MEALPPHDELWHDRWLIYLPNGELSELPENPSCPTVQELYLQNNPDLTEIPPSFFLAMPQLRYLNLSYTSIKTLPPSISSLVGLQQLWLRGCELLMELPPEIGALRNLQKLDLRGTELICLPKEIKGLLQLKWFYVTFYKSPDQYKGFEAFIPRSTLSKFSQLLHLIIDVNQEECGSSWDVECEAVIRELASLENLTRLELFLPTVELLQQFLQLPCRRKRAWRPDMPLVYQTLLHFRLTVGRDQQRVITSCLPKGLLDEFGRLNRCLKYVNGEGSNDGIGKALKHANALFLDRHWTISSLSVFKPDETRQLNCCLLVQCNEMKTIFDGGGDDDHPVDRKGKETNGLESLQYLSIHCMKNLESIWKGPKVRGWMCLKVLALHTCPKLSTIFDIGLLRNLRWLEAIIVEECPQVQSLVKMESSSVSHSEYDDDNDHSKFLPRLKRISLLHLPELVSIFNGLLMAPRLERLVVYNCPRLKNLSPVKSELIKEIKGEREWWESLEWPSNQIPNNLVRVFVPLARDGDLMDQLEESRSSINNLDTIQSSWESQIMKRSVIASVADSVPMSKIGAIWYWWIFSVFAMTAWIVFVFAMTALCTDILASRLVEKESIFKISMVDLLQDLLNTMKNNYCLCLLFWFLFFYVLGCSIYKFIHNVSPPR